MIQRRWRAKLEKRGTNKSDGANAKSAPTVPSGEVSAQRQTEGNATSAVADGSGGGQEVDGIPPGLTKMQQMAWKKRRPPPAAPPPAPAAAAAPATPAASDDVPGMPEGLTKMEQMKVSSQSVGRSDDWFISFVWPLC